jgi:hypothetical protein
MMKQLPADGTTMIGSHWELAVRLSLRLGQLPGLGQAALGYGLDDLAGAPVVRGHDPARRDRFQRGPGCLVVLTGRDQGQGQVKPGRGGTARSGRPVCGGFETGQDMPGVALGGRVAGPRQGGGDIRLGLGRVVPVVVLGPIRDRQWRD